MILDWSASLSVLSTPDARQHSFWRMWCVFVCHPHLTIILCCTAVWAQACGLERNLVQSASAIVFTSLSVCWWGSITILLLLVHFIRTVATVTIPVTLPQNIYAELIPAKKKTVAA